MTALLRSLVASAGLAATAVVLTVSSPAAGAVTFFASGTSTEGTPVAMQADFTLAGTSLTLVLSNVSPTPSVHAADVLSSFYFDIVKDGVRPTLSYASAQGMVWQVKSDSPDIMINSKPSLVVGQLPHFTPVTDPALHVPSDLRAFKSGDQSWQFKPMDVAASPFLGFGLGTVGNSGFGSNGFSPFIVGPPGKDMIAFGIYKDSLVMPEGKPMQNQYLVRDTATFVFTSPLLANYTTADIAPHVVFGLGTGPDSILAVPEPAGLAGLAGAVVWAAGWAAVRRRRAAAARGAGRGVAAPAAAAAAGLLLGPGLAAADAVPVATWDFAAGPSGWVAQNQNKAGTTSSPNTWAWAKGEGVWRVEPYPVLFTWVANHLTSPLITVPEATDLLAVTMRHRFHLPVSVEAPGKPVALGQVVYRVFDTPPARPFDDPRPFLPLPASSWLDEPLVPSAESRGSAGSSVLPSYLVPAALPPMVAGGMAFSGTSPGLERDAFVVSRFTIDGLLEPGQFVQLRFINGNLGGICTDARWDVAVVGVEALLVPEPGGLALAAAGGVAAAATGCLSGRRLRHRPGRERELLTTGLRARA
jgi:hypothetical protein